MTRGIGEIPAQIWFKLRGGCVFVESHERANPFIIELREVTDILACNLGIVEQLPYLGRIFLGNLQTEGYTVLISNAFEAIDGIADGYSSTLFVFLAHLLTPHVLHDIVGKGCSDGIRRSWTPFEHVG